MVKLIGKKPLYMWQADRKILIEDESVKWVDFAHDTDEKALRVDVREVDEMPKHDCLDYLLREQQRGMDEYLHIIEVRAVIEGIEL